MKGDRLCVKGNAAEGGGFALDPFSWADGEYPADCRKFAESYRVRKFTVCDALATGGFIFKTFY